MRGDIYLRGDDVKETTSKLTFLLSPTRSFCFSFSTLNFDNGKTVGYNFILTTAIERQILKLPSDRFMKF